MGKSIKEKCKENGITLSCYYYRIYKLGYTPAQALSTPKQKEHATKKKNWKIGRFLRKTSRKASDEANKLKYKHN